MIILDTTTYSRSFEMNLLKIISRHLKLQMSPKKRCPIRFHMNLQQPDKFYHYSEDCHQPGRIQTHFLGGNYLIKVFQQNYENGCENGYEKIYQKGTTKINWCGQIQFIISLLQLMIFKFLEEESQFKLDNKNRRKKAQAENNESKYSVVPYQKRVKLIKLTINKGYSINKASKQLGIKPSTGKFIVKCYKDQGRIMKKIGKSKPKTPCSNQKTQENSFGSDEKPSKQVAAPKTQTWSSQNSESSGLAVKLQNINSENNLGYPEEMHPINPEILYNYFMFDPSVYLPTPVKLEEGLIFPHYFYPYAQC